jgi:hypothetical protein
MLYTIFFFLVYIYMDINPDRIYNDNLSNITRTLLNKTILSELPIELIINELNENEERSNDTQYYETKKITFGKYKNKTFGYLARNEPHYIIWLYDKDINPHKNISRKFLRYYYYIAKDYRRMKYQNHFKKKYYY